MISGAQNFVVGQVSLRDRPRPSRLSPLFPLLIAVVSRSFSVSSGKGPHK